MPHDYGLGPGFEPMHIDRKSLYVNLEERIKYLHHFIEWSSADVEALQHGTKYLKQLIPAVVNMVYKKLLVYDITSRAFHTRTTADEREPDEDYLTEETPQIKRRKMFLRWYLTRLCQDPTSMDFWRYLNKIGQMHCGQERLAPLNVEYIHLGICLGYIQDIFFEALMFHPQLSMRRKVALVRAINKIIWIQNDLFAKWHVRDGEEFADEISMYSFGSGNREGFLAGKRIIGSSSGSSVDDDRSSIADSASVAPSMQSVAPSEQSFQTSASVQSDQTVNTASTATGSGPQDPAAAMISACPFADFAKKSSSTETKIWAN
ncbi:hypothetical protein N7478_004310 [Penicillium angulare]|uniref:uncharacterized protein n=1 Tax=Penicillium angulare TaxID=116970 RepID=UPI002540DC78|nr:uncharacterized protein N7478_004310 [Penicillium angulare]KAJ5278938.1 hypothetical protein N7478_004310 [Penicillium angulare]